MESPAGLSQPDLLAGPLTDPHGSPVFPVNPSPARARARVSTTSGTSGQPGSRSLKPASRKSSSASKSHPQKLSDRSLRLLSLTRFSGVTSRAQIELQTSLSKAIRSIITENGSMEYKQTWRERVTPSGLRFLEHTARQRRISDKDCTGWPTTKAKDGREWSHNAPKDSSSGHGLGAAAQLTPWPSPTTPSGGQTWPEGTSSTGVRPDGSKATVNLDQVAQLTPWATASSRDWKDTPGMSETGVNPDGTARERLDQLPRQAQLCPWHTPDTRPDAPNSQSHCKNVAAGLGNQVSGATTESSAPATGSSGASRMLNPFFSAWLMSFPPAWTLCGIAAHLKARSAKSKKPSAVSRSRVKSPEESDS